jgi:2-oxoglutarate dehydrogenase E2 component (dihydrolipoamide succinyltransferase)
MSVEIVVPALGESISEATIAKWNKKPGDIIKVDDLLLELETEKVTLEVNSHVAGVLDKTLKNQGDTVSVGEVVGHITEGIDIAKPTQATIARPEESKISTEMPKKVNPVTSMPPSVQKLVTENNLNPMNIAGSGRDGRITKEDALHALNTQPASAIKPMTTYTDKPIERVKMSRLRKTIAQRLKDSQNTAAILTTFNELDMTNVIILRQKYREEFEKKHGIKLGFMSFFVKASIEALKAISSINAEIDGDDIVYKNYYDIGVAVGTEQGLVVPVVRGSDQLTFAGIEKEIANLGKKAKEGKLSMADLSGGTFSISNGGIYGSLLSTPIINPPQSGILGLHKVQERPVVINGKVEVRSMMYVALSYDHRIVDGREAVTFLVKIKEAIENPERLLLNI